MDICKELKTMASLRFQNICQVHGGCVIDDQEIWLVLEFVEGGNLHNFLSNFDGPLPHDLQLSFFIQAAKAINYLHTSPSPILHRDIKSHNFLVRDKSKLLLTDFGLSKAVELVVPKTLTIGTLNWAAPEVVINSKWSEKADIYSLGMVFFEIVSHEIPFQNDTNLMQIAKGISEEQDPKFLTVVPRQVFISLCTGIFTN
jgi:eukaryotic-like serine/threonine-protein kinase